jgi:hypothetical protein
MKPYTYYLYHKQTNTHYYGVRYAKTCDPSDLWITYFSSSKKVKKLIDEYGADSFSVEVRKTFDGREQAILWEQKVLRRLKVLSKPEWLNDNISGAILLENHPKGFMDKKHTDSVKEKIGRRTKNKTYEEIYGDRAAEQRQQRSDSHKNKPKLYLKGKTYEEIHGIEKAQKLKEIRSKRKGYKVLDFRKPEKRECPHCGKLYDPGNLKRHLNRITIEAVVV